MRMLVVEDDVALREAICASAANWTINLPDGRAARFEEILQASSVDEGTSALSAGFNLLLVDVKLGTDSGITLAERASRAQTVPLVLAMSRQATATEAFQLAALGVRGYLGKPFDMRELREAIQAVFQHPPDLGPTAMAQVGHRHIHVVQDQVKIAMLKRALNLENGNITRAARRLGITRAAVQQMLDRYEIPRPRNSANDTDADQEE
jgi:DNA-binding response OmpR family regulator